MNRIFLIIILLSLSSDAVACTVPYSGPEFNGLVKIKRNSAESLFTVSLPSKLENTESAKVYLAYTKLPLSEFIIAEYVSELKLSDSNNIQSGKFFVETRDGYTPYLRVYWNAKPCSTVANTFFDIKPNQVLENDANESVHLD